MKKVFLWALELVALPFVLALMFLHYLGLLFAVSLVVAGITGWGFGTPWALAFFSTGWKVYVGLGVFTFAFLTTFTFQNCCVGIQSFAGHLKHRGWKGVIKDVLYSLIWPWCWYRLDRFLKAWEGSLVDALFNAFEYWFVSSWRGITVTIQNFQTGETTTRRVKHK